MYEQRFPSAYGSRRTALELVLRDVGSSDSFACLQRCFSCSRSELSIGVGILPDAFPFFFFFFAHGYYFSIRISSNRLKSHRNWSQRAWLLAIVPKANHTGEKSRSCIPNPDSSYKIGVLLPRYVEIMNGYIIARRYPCIVISRFYCSTLALY